MAISTSTSTSTRRVLQVVLNPGNRYCKLIVDGRPTLVQTSALRLLTSAAVADTPDAFEIQPSGRHTSAIRFHTAWSRSGTGIYPVGCEQEQGKVYFTVPLIFSLLWDYLEADQDLRLVVTTDSSFDKQGLESLCGAFTCVHNGSSRRIQIKEVTQVAEGRGLVETVGDTALIDLGGSTVIATKVVNGAASPSIRIRPEDNTGYNYYRNLVADAICAARIARSPSEALIDRLATAPASELSEAEIAVVKAAAKEYATFVVGLIRTGNRRMVDNSVTLCGGLAASDFVFDALVAAWTAAGVASVTRVPNPQVADLDGVWTVAERLRKFGPRVTEAESDQAEAKRRRAAKKKTAEKQAATAG